MRRIGILLGLTLLSALASVSTGSASTVTGSAGISGDAGIAASYSDCPKGDVCFYSGSNGTGNMCNWDVSDPDWRSGAITCFGVTTPRSIYNNGYAGGYDDVVYYINTGYNDRIGCTRVGVQGNLAGTYVVRSHQWVTSC